MSKVYGYLRVSTEQQDVNSNKAEILLKANELQLGTNVIWIDETITGKKHWKERKLGQLMDSINSGDFIIMSEISRIGRTTLQIFEFISICAQKKVTLYCTKGDIKIDDSIQSQAIIFANSISSQIERELISQRTKSALKAKKDKGIILGRPKNKLKLDKHLDDITKLINSGVKYCVIAKKYNVSCNTMTTFIKKKIGKSIEKSDIKE